MLRPGRVGGPREREVGNREGEQDSIRLPRTLGSRLRDVAWRYPWRCSRLETLQGVDKKSELSKLPGAHGEDHPSHLGRRGPRRKADRDSQLAVLPLCRHPTRRGAWRLFWQAGDAASCRPRVRLGRSQLSWQPPVSPGTVAPSWGSLPPSLGEGVSPGHPWSPRAGRSRGFLIQEPTPGHQAGSLSPGLK